MVHLPWCIAAAGCASLTGPGGDVTHTSIGCLFGFAPQNDSVVLYASFGPDHNGPALSPHTARQRGRCVSVTQEIVLQRFVNATVNILYTVSFGSQTQASIYNH